MIKRLQQTRDDYAAELIWHKFLLDAYTGTGGFAGKIKQPARGYLGWAAEIYGTGTAASAAGVASFDTYLDRYPREDSPKFARRIEVAHYPGYVEAIVDLLLSYVLKREMAREGIPKQITDWAQDVDGSGTSWDEMLENTLIPRAALLGWIPLLIDADATPEGTTKAQTQGSRVRALPLFPANLLDWETDESGHFVWAKVRLDYTKRDGPLGDERKEQHYHLWSRTTVRKFVVVDDGRGQRVESDGGEQPNPFGFVPLSIWRHKPSPDDAVRGLGMVDGIASQVRRLFNLLSELDEHMRQQVFALLQVPQSPNATGGTELQLGTDNALPLPHESKHEYKYIAPPASVADTYETRIAATVDEIYRLARSENDRGKAVSSTSGVARAYEFEKTNRRLGDFAKQLARAERRTYHVLGRVMGLDDKALEGTMVTAPTDFKVEDLATALENATQAITLGIGGTAEARIKQRVVDKMLPNLSPVDKATIDAEIEQERVDDEVARAAAKEAPVEPDPDADTLEDEDEAA